MCGIFAYTGTKRAAPLLLEGLKTLEYRGYDSAGVFLPEEGLIRAVGPVDSLRPLLPANSSSFSGIAHTRWATHGTPSEANTHPHTDCRQEFFVVHNGIVENYQALRSELVCEGHTFRSETDTEVIAHLLEREYARTQDVTQAVRAALALIQGTYGLALMHRSRPELIVLARMGSPLVLGVKDGERFAASDASAIVRHTADVVYLEDGDVAFVTPGEHWITTGQAEPIIRTVEHVSWNIEEAQKQGYPHFMLKEIMEGPLVLENALRGRLLVEEGRVQLGGLRDVAERLRSIRRLVLVGCGTAYHAALTGKYMIEEYANLPVEVDVGSEFRYRNILLDEHTAVLVVSQSGETADTLWAVREARRKGVLVLGLVNVVGSTIARETDAGIYNHAGPEVSVASTKAFVSQLSIFALLTMFLGRQRGMSMMTGRELASELAALPDKMRQVLLQADSLRVLAATYAHYEHFLFIGRRYAYPLALEGALKLTETSYIHAQGYAAGELKHGHIALVDEKMPVCALVTDSAVREKLLSNIQEIKARRGLLWAVGIEGDCELADLADQVISIPQTLDVLSPILTAIPLQLFAYYCAVRRGVCVDRPRNLAKSVTVE